MRVRPQALSKNLSVKEDWDAWLPLAKSEAFDSYVGQLEIAYNMFSVALNDALELRRTGKYTQACQSMLVIPDLCSRLAHSLEALLRSLGEHAKHFGTIPKSVPLDSANFRGPYPQHSARMSELLSHLLLTQRSLFLHKIDVLEELVAHIRKNVQDTVLDVACGASLQPSLDWKALDDAHFDLNTCLREFTVLFKSFLVVLPDDQLPGFRDSVTSFLRNSGASFTRTHLVNHRRMIPIEGK